MIKASFNRNHSCGRFFVRYSGYLLYLTVCLQRMVFIENKTKKSLKESSILYLHKRQAVNYAVIPSSFPIKNPTLAIYRTFSTDFCKDFAS